MRLNRQVRKTSTGGMLAIAAALFAGALTTASPVLAKDITVHPASCRATFLNQAGPMRWHEYFLMNPDTNQSTYIICPMTYDPDVVVFGGAGGQFSVQIYGGIMDGSGGSGLPFCEFKVHQRDNLRQGIYINRPPNHTYSIGMAAASQGNLWAASANVQFDDIAEDVGTTNWRNWAASLVCLMSPGHSVSWISLND